MTMERKDRYWIGCMLGLMVCLASAALLSAQSRDTAIEPDDNDAEAAQEEAPVEQPSNTATDVMEQLLQQRDASPVVQPETGPAIEYIENRLGVMATKADLDQSVIGVAPGLSQPKLRREGDFIVSRRGRLIRSPDGSNVLFVFSADSKHASEPPMIMQKCRRLEDMENYVQKRGDNVIFIVSGQIHTYRGANYLLPTMMKIATDQGNIQ